MRLTPVMEKYIRHWGEMGERWGMNRSIAQIHALLYLADRPVPADEITETLGIARSNVSNSLRELQGWGLVRLSHLPGDRRDHFEVRQDPWDMLVTIGEGRKRREIDPTLEMLRECTAELKSDKETPASVRARIEGMQSFLEQLERWYEQMRQVPRATLLKLLGLGAKVAAFVGR